MKNKLFIYTRGWVFAIIVVVFAFSPLIVTANQPEKQLTATSVVLVEQTTGRVLYARNAHDRRYPASTTKMLTAILAYQYLDLDAVVTVGSEIFAVPAGFTMAGHFEGQTVTVRTLLHALLIPSGNDSAMTLAVEVARATENRIAIPTNEAQAIFSTLMNNKARELGAFNSNFNNPFGLHHESHYTTAYDMALIGRAFMDSPTLAAISATREFSSWINTSQMLPGTAFAYPFITGGRTGFTTPAGHCFVAGAYHNGLALVAAVLYSREPDRWNDMRILLDYGFFNYAFREVATDNQFLKNVLIENPRLGDENTLKIHQKYGHTALLSLAEYDVIERVITFDPHFLLVEYEETTFQAPIEYGETVGLVEYRIGNDVIFSTPLVASRYVIERTFDSDMDYYMAMIFSNIFTRRGLPYWFGTVGTILGITGICVAIRTHERAKKAERWNTPNSRKRRGV